MSQDILAQAWASGVTYTMEEAKQELKYELNSVDGINDDDPDVAKVMLLLGPHGCGKTAITKQACLEAKAEYAAYHHGATVEEDNHGLPVIEERDGIKVVGQAKPKHLPCFFRKPESESGKGALVLHEPFTGGIGHQNILRMMTERCHNADHMFPGWILVATSNPETAEYVTVKAVDAALASRMVILVVKPSNDEKMAYWSGRMHPLVYKFLLLTHCNKDLNFIDKLDSRSWYNLADSLGRRHAVGASRDSLVKLLTTHAGIDVADGFNKYMEHGNDPYYFPIGAAELISADKPKLRELLSRVRQWISNAKTDITLLGATNWDLGAWVRERSHGYTKPMVGNLNEYMQVLGSNGHIEFVDDLFQNSRGQAIMSDLIKLAKGTAVESRIVDIYEKHNKEKARLEVVKAKKRAATP